MSNNTRQTLIPNIQVPEEGKKTSSVGSWPPYSFQLNPHRKLSTSRSSEIKSHSIAVATNSTLSSCVTHSSTHSFLRSPDRNGAHIAHLPHPPLLSYFPFSSFSTNPLTFCRIPAITNILYKAISNSVRLRLVRYLSLTFLLFLCLSVQFSLVLLSVEGEEG